MAAVLEQLLALPQVLTRAEAAAGENLSETTLRQIAALAYLHDAGKLAPGFQSKGWRSELRVPLEGHLLAGQEWFSHRATEPGRVREVLGWGLDGWYAALFAHHGRPVELITARGSPWKKLPHYDWCAGEAQFLDGLERWFWPGGCERLPTSPRLQHLFAGLLALADWIGSDRRWFDFVPEFQPAYGDLARLRARQALAGIGLDPEGWRPEAPPGFTDLTGFEPNDAQRAVAALPGEEQLIILEAETGSGKTEAALFRFARLLAERRVDGLYFALPTRAAAAQVQGRISRALAAWLGTASPGVTMAIPGQIQVDAHQGYRLPGWEVRWEDEPDPRRWAAEHATRFLAAPVAVGTVDQAMMAALAVKHAPMRAAALARNLLVIDEVHASDAYMRRILRQLLDDHLALGGHAMLMSATLGSVARTDWRKEPRTTEAEAAALPFPAVWTRRGIVREGAPGRPKTVEVSVKSGMEPLAVAQRALEAAHDGARVLVVRNTVATAVASWVAASKLAPELLLEAAGGPALHHARFAAEDRRLLDGAVEAALGKASGAIPRVVIGTQTLEQALDIDADFLLTDICPMDVLLQRIGRLHRHDRPRPERFGTPRVEVVIPQSGFGRLAELDRPISASERNGLGGWLEGGSLQGIYVNLAGLEAVRRAIGEGAIWRIPEMNRVLVEAATHPEPLAAITREMGWEDYANRVLAKELAAGQHARLVLYAKSGEFEDAFKPLADDGPVRTRLGAEGAVLRLKRGTIGPFGTEITELALPAHWSRGLTGEEEVTVEPDGPILTLRVADRMFRYSRAGLAKAG